MIFKETSLKGAYIIEIEPMTDERGFFARTFCIDEFKKNGLDFNIVQCNVSYNKKKGTLRGMHYQANPYEEAKLISCIRGAVYDVSIDLRKGSPTYCQWYAVELKGGDNRLLYLPEGFAHGFQTLEGNSEVFYQMSQFYSQEHARGVRWNDPAFRIDWPYAEKRMISDRDRSFGLFLDY